VELPVFIYNVDEVIAMIMNVIQVSVDACGVQYV